VGLISGVLLLPLAPVRGVGWIAQVLAEEAERRMAAEASPARALEDVAAAVANGEISDEKAAALEAEIVERMLAGQGGDGWS
jgi:Gas vesicle protein G